MLRATKNSTPTLHIQEQVDPIVCSKDFLAGISTFRELIQKTKSLGLPASRPVITDSYAPSLPRDMNTHTLLGPGPVSENIQCLQQTIDQQEDEIRQLSARIRHIRQQQKVVRDRLENSQYSCVSSEQH